MSWLNDEKLKLIEDAGDLEASFKAFLLHLQNEMTAGHGTVNPPAVIQDCVDAADDLLDAFQVKAKAAPTGGGKKAD